ncbi:ABC transporter substrate-binding protein [Aureimonas jatrophae]|uniref:Peptide/nickel transport system substrate-binding protein n=1 Tax=Aureimonas jatrophae TaxID=1166073 RepID=A0A1H0HBK6_9HYPH|nr:ABC transporter substrate-binding protein [Aureimonas jatrophae]MBB3950506.1 peptide/nickel transport system substrate-binding protein [Aureimonas jatrophae]SDO16545.1 peptide/nickel transport system substrate-binding protein [Aureimonas jatrophae]
MVRRVPETLSTAEPMRQTVALLALLPVLLCAAGPAAAAAKTDLVLAIGGEPETGYDPLLGWGAYGHPLFQSTLLRRDADLRTEGDLASSWTLSDDRLTWTVQIRNDAVFSDGTALTARDVAFTYTQGARTAGALDLSVLESATARDDATVVLRLKKPWITFTETFFSLGIVPAASYGPDYARHPIGSGPYRLVSWSEGEQLIVERNPGYYGKKPAFERVTFLFTGEDAGLAAAQAGAVDMVSVPAPLADAVPDGFRAESVRTVDNRGISLPFLPDTGRRDANGGRIGNAVTSDRAVRQAINLGLDRAAIVEVALHGHGTPAFGPADGLAWAGEADRVSFDLAAARRILDEAGWREGSDGIRVRGGVRAAFPIHYPASDTTRQSLAEVAAELLRPLGIEATPEGSSWDAINRVMHAEPVIFGFGSHSPYQLYSLYESSLGGVEYLNPTFYANEAVDAAFAQAQAASGLEASYPFWRRAAFDGTTGYGLQGDAAWAWLVNLDHVYFVNRCLDIGRPQIEPHGHGWPITASIADWRWTCE